MNRHESTFDRVWANMEPLDFLIGIVALAPEENRQKLVEAMSEDADPLAKKVGLYFLARKQKQVKVLAV